MAAIEIEGLSKTFKLGFFRRSVPALRGLDLQVEEGEIFGFLGPNGAGKTTTIKILVGLIYPSAGKASLFGVPVANPQSRRNVGFLPENPYFYEHLKPLEFLLYYGQLLGLSDQERRRQAETLLQRVGLEHAMTRPVRKFSKGMLQRLGLAQAILGYPKLVILDEPMTGLDPVGRKHVRDIIVELKQQGTTVFLSSHILSDVEMICDRVAILVQGQLRQVRSVRAFLDEHVLGTEVTARNIESPEAIAAPCSWQRHGDSLTFLVEDDQHLAALLREITDRGGRIMSVSQKKQNLEDILLREIERESLAADGGAQADP